MKFFITCFFLFFLPFFAFAQTKGKIVYKNLLEKKTPYKRDSKHYVLFRQDTLIEISESYLSFNNTSNVLLRAYYKEKMMASAMLKHDHDTEKKENTIYIDHALDSQKVNIRYVEEHKEILGFKCQKAYIQTLFYSAKFSETIERNYVVYFTSIIKNFLSEFQSLQGMPLEYALLEGEKYKSHNQAIDIQYDIKLPQVLTFQSLYPDYDFKKTRD